MNDHNEDILGPWTRYDDFSMDRMYSDDESSPLSLNTLDNTQPTDGTTQPTTAPNQFVNDTELSIDPQVLFMKPATPPPRPNTPKRTKTKSKRPSSRTSLQKSRKKRRKTFAEFFEPGFPEQDFLLVYELEADPRPSLSLLVAMLLSTIARPVTVIEVGHAYWVLRTGRAKAPPQSEQVNADVAGTDASSETVPEGAFNFQDAFNLLHQLNKDPPSALVGRLARFLTRKFGRLVTQDALHDCYRAQRPRASSTARSTPSPSPSPSPSVAQMDAAEDSSNSASSSSVVSRGYPEPAVATHKRSQKAKRRRHRPKESGRADSSPQNAVLRMIPDDVPSTASAALPPLTQGTYCPSLKHKVECSLRSDWDRHKKAHCAIKYGCRCCFIDLIDKAGDTTSIECRGCKAVLLGAVVLKEASPDTFLPIRAHMDACEPVQAQIKTYANSKQRRMWKIPNSREAAANPMEWVFKQMQTHFERNHQDRRLTPGLREFICRNHLATEVFFEETRCRTCGNDFANPVALVEHIEEIHFPPSKPKTSKSRKQNRDNGNDDSRNGPSGGQSRGGQSRDNGFGGSGNMQGANNTHAPHSQPPSGNSNGGSYHASTYTQDTSVWSDMLPGRDVVPFADTGTRVNLMTTDYLLVDENIQLNPVSFLDSCGEQFTGTKTQGTPKHRLGPSTSPSKQILQGRLGRGGTSVVDAVWDPQRQTQLARKRIAILDTGLPPQDSVQQVRREVKALTSLRHRHIISLVDWHVGSPGTMDLMLDPAADDNLMGLMLSGASVPGMVNRVASWMGCLASAIDYLHGASLRHGDIKPQNILIVNTRVCLGDFGTAEFQHEAAGLGTARRWGTRVYEPPEASSRAPMTRAADIWSFGCVLIEVCTWLGGKSIDALRKSHGSEPLPYHVNGPATLSWVKNLRHLYREGEGLRDKEYLLDAIGFMLVRKPGRRINAHEAWKGLTRGRCVECPCEFVTSPGISEPPSRTAGEPFLPDLPHQPRESGLPQPGVQPQSRYKELVATIAPKNKRRFPKATRVAPLPAEGVPWALSRQASRGDGAQVEHSSDNSPWSPSQHTWKTPAQKRQPAEAFSPWARDEFLSGPLSVEELGTE